MAGAVFGDVRTSVFPAGSVFGHVRGVTFRGRGNIRTKSSRESHCLLRPTRGAECPMHFATKLHHTLCQVLCGQVDAACVQVVCASFLSSLIHFADTRQCHGKRYTAMMTVLLYL